MTLHRAARAAAAVFSCASALYARAATPLETGLISLPASADSIHYNVPLISLPLTAPPINGFVPQVVFTVTDQEDRNVEDFYSVRYTLPASTSSWSPFGNYTPVSTPGPTYFIATFDTGSQSHIISYADAQTINLEAAGRAGDNVQPITGASGDEDADISDALGIYSTSFSNASSNGTTLSAIPGTLQGHWNTSILTAQQGSVLPNIIGSPMAGQYQTVISNTNTRHLTVNNQTYRSPNVSFQALNTALPANYVRLTLNLQPSGGFTPTPSYFPSLENFENWGDNPSSPSFWASMMATATATHTAGSSGGQDFLFDTGAQVTVLSEDTAASVGYYSVSPDPNTPPSTPDFTVEIAGVGGTTTQVPGFYLNTLSVTTNGGPMTWTHVPVIVLDLPDPRDGVGFVPGILGTNLFTDRDLVINGGTTNPYVGISPIITARWATNAPGTWGSDDNWVLGVPDAADAPANFTSAITAPTTVTVEGNHTAGSITFNNANRYTLAGPGTITLQTTTATPPSINVLSGSHTIAAKLAFASPATLTIVAGAQLDVTNNSLVLSTPAATIRQYLLSNQLTSSTPDPNNLTSLGYLTTTSTLVKLTYTGDANLDGKITADDYALLDKGRATGGTVWQLGDFNYDGAVTPADYLLIDRVFALQGPPLSPDFLASRESEFGEAYVAALLTSIPEPTSLFAACGVALLSRRRR